MNMEILTPSGFQKFEGIKRYWHDQYLKFVFEDDSTVETAYNHRFIVQGKEIFAKNVFIGEDIGKIVKDIIEIKEGDYFYDPINVSNGKIYNHDDGLVSHNTFHGRGNTLINAETLMSLRTKQPVEIIEGGDMLVYEKPIETSEYIMSVDVGQGKGLDYSVFTIIDISVSPFKQVAVYRNNTISPLLFPNIIYKYAKVYNNAYVIVESNDQGCLVCNGLYQDLEYENVHMEMGIKGKSSVGQRMTTKVKRLGCSGFKDILENKKLDVCDEQTILEISTFISKGISFEASDNNHDDLVMAMVMFGFFAQTDFFESLTNVNIKEMLFQQRMQQIEDDIPPFGFIEDGSNSDFSGMREDPNSYVFEYYQDDDDMKNGFL